MPDVTDYRRIKAKVLNLMPVVEGERDMSFSVNGIAIHLKHGAEVELLEPVYNALKGAVVTTHQIRTVFDSQTGTARNIDEIIENPKYEVVTMGDFFWPDGHTKKRRQKQKSEIKEAAISMKDVASEVRDLVDVVRSSQFEEDVEDIEENMDENTTEEEL